MKRRALTLRKETLSELTPGELQYVVGGTSATCVTYTILVTGCMCTGMYPSLNVDCPTGRRCAD